MADTMLVGVDGSESSRRAVDFAATRAKAGDARLIVAHVIEWSPYTFNTPEENEIRHRRREEEIARAQTQSPSSISYPAAPSSMPLEKLSEDNSGLRCSTE